MLFEYISLALIAIMAMAIPVIGIIAFRHGYSLGVKDYNHEHRDAPKADIAPKMPKQPKVDKKLKMYSQILENIDNYDGTSAHQKDVEVV